MAPSASLRRNALAEVMTWLIVLAGLLCLSALLRTAQLAVLKRPWRSLDLATPRGESVEQRRVEWNRDYSIRLGSALAAGRSQRHQRFLRWLHVPKTGTSFVNTLVRWGCPGAAKRDTFVVPRKERPKELALTYDESFSWDWLFTNESGREWLRENCEGRLVTRHPNSGEHHYTMYMHLALRTWEVSNAVAMFRLPLQRTYSNYMHLSLHYNESRAPREPLHKFLTKRQFWSQQTKLVLGRHYRDVQVVTRRDALKAALIVKKRLKFVGLTEEFELSSRLFHAMFGGVPHRAQFENIRPGLSRYQSSEKRASSFRYDESQFNGWTDPADDFVYNAARQRFWSDVDSMKEEIELDGLGEVNVQTEQLTI